MTSDFLQKEPTNFILMTQEPTALQSIAPTRHSIHHRISGAILLLPITILLSACNEQWTISKIWVNPQPLAGNETVFPVVLVAPSQQRVVMEVVFDRDTNFTNRIGFKVSYSFYEPVEQHYDSSWLDWVASSRGHAVILDCFCSRSNAGRPLNLVVRGVTGNPPFQVVVDGIAQAKATLNIEVTSKDENAEEYVTSSAAKALEISCLRDSPIQ